MEFTTPLTVDSDVSSYEPQLSGATSITGKISTLHGQASDDVAKQLRIRWWADVLRGNVGNPWFQTGMFIDESMKTLSGMDTAKLSAAQLKYLAVCRLLGWHVWPMLNTHNDETTLASKKAAEWKKKFSDEMDLLLQNGIAYDWDDDGTAELYVEAVVGRKRSVRIERE